MAIRGREWGAAIKFQASVNAQVHRLRLTLARPYTFVVMAILIMIFGVLSAIRTPTDVFPNIGIPVISVVWSYTGLAPDDMAGRIIAPYEQTRDDR